MNIGTALDEVTFYLQRDCLQLQQLFIGSLYLWELPNNYINVTRLYCTHYILEEYSPLLWYFPNLKSLHLIFNCHLVDEELILLLRHYTQLTELSINHCVNVTNESLLEIPIHCKQLRYLSLMQCDLTDQTVINIAQNCKQLRYFCGSHCSGLSESVQKQIAFFSTKILDDMFNGLIMNWDKMPLFSSNFKSNGKSTDYLDNAMEH